MKPVRKKRRGFTLVEVLISFAIFAVLGTIVAQFIRVYAFNQLKTDANSDIDRALSLTAGRLETLLRGCQVVNPPVGGTSAVLEFAAPEIDEAGLIVVTAAGDPAWLPNREISLSGGSLVITGPSPVLVGTLGPLGSVIFERPVGSILKVSLTAGFDVRETVVRKAANLRVSLPVVP